MQLKYRLFLSVCLLSQSHILIATFLFSKLLLKPFFFRLPDLTRLVKFMPSFQVSSKHMVMSLKSDTKS